MPQRKVAVDNAAVLELLSAVSQSTGQKPLAKQAAVCRVGTEAKLTQQGSRKLPWTGGNPFGRSQQSSSATHQPGNMAVNSPDTGAGRKQVIEKENSTVIIFWSNGQSQRLQKVFITTARWFFKFAI